MTALAVYRAAATLGGPLIRLYLSRRLKRGKEDAARFGERLGRPGLPRPEGRLVWLHAASIGEAVSVLPLIDRLRCQWPGQSVLLTTGTVTSARLMTARLPEGAVHQYVPVDRPAYVRSFLAHWRPDLAVWAESEFWPVLITETARLGVPMVLLQGRVSDASLVGWRRHPRLIRQLLSCFELCLGQSETDAQRLAVLGARASACRGNLKLAAPALPADAAELAELQAAFGMRPRWLAASTHPGEEAIAGGVHRRVRLSLPRLLTLVVPRHPERGDAVVRDLRGAGLVVAQRSRGEPVTDGTDVYVADTVGELGVFYRLAPVAFIGKSLSGVGGQNPLEAAQLGSVVVYGPQMGNFVDISAQLSAAGASITVDDEEGLAATVLRLLTDATERTRRAEAGRCVVEAEAGVLDAVLEKLKPFMPACRAPGEAGAGEVRRARA
ncbi:MAG: 3-deoxy-D-manno-octulosonic acid transferase [Rhodospirillales bacterium]|nr:MAG: 3-deoxy-D-manno-octulosonic acid transferase [Rhodospirillales bacterium]